MSLAGKRVVFTGTIHFRIAAAAAWAKAVGAKVAARIGDSTDIVVVGSDAIYTAEVVTAKKKGTAVWTEKKFNAALAKSLATMRDNFDIGKRGSTDSQVPEAKRRKLGPPSKAEVKEFLSEIGLEPKPWDSLMSPSSIRVLFNREGFLAAKYESVDILRQLVRHSMLMKLKKGRDVTSPCSKLGGKPWMQKGDAWPACKCCRGNMRFRLQVNLAEVPKNDTGKNNGLLQLWVCDDSDARDCLGNRAFSGTSFLRLVPQRDINRHDAETSVPKGVKLYPVKLVESWISRAEIPHPEELQATCGFGGEDMQLLDFLGCEGVKGEKVGGWPSWCQNVDYPDCPKCNKPMENVLFQLESGTIEGAWIGDGGTAHITQCAKHRDQLAYAWACC